MSFNLRPQFVTQQQLTSILAAWGQDTTPPAKREQRVITWPSSADVECECARVIATGRRSEYGKRLYSIELGSVEQIFGVVQDTLQ
jgi:hypothetical protein